VKSVTRIEAGTSKGSGKTMEIDECQNLEKIKFYYSKIFKRSGVGPGSN